MLWEELISGVLLVSTSARENPKGRSSALKYFIFFKKERTLRSTLKVT